MLDPLTSPRKPRIDSLRNRERLLAAARSAFVELGGDAPLEEIARRAEVGIGTLYRHFPSRDALLEGMYRDAAAQLAEAAPTLLAQMDPIDALHQWMKLFIEFIAAKRVVSAAFRARPDDAKPLYATSRQLILQAVTLLLQRGTEQGDIREGITPADMMRAMTGIAQGFEEPGWEESAGRLVDILVGGLRTLK